MENFTHGKRESTTEDFVSVTNVDGDILAESDGEDANGVNFYRDTFSSETMKFLDAEA